MNSGGFWAPFVSAGPFALGIILILFVLSVASWAIFLQKLRQFRQASGQTKGFLSVFGYRRGLNDYQELTKMFPSSPLAALLNAAVEEWNILNVQFGLSAATDMLGQLVPNITEAMERAGSRETDRLESYLSFLAITTMVAPFLGLLGTVQGVLRTFLSLRGAQMPTLQLIAPGISDALITTVMGLLVAIPAALFYNYFVGRVRSLQSEMERFISEMTGVFRREVIATGLSNQQEEK